jgi:hypothetical protein
VQMCVSAIQQVHNCSHRESVAQNLVHEKSMRRDKSNFCCRTCFNSVLEESAQPSCHSEAQRVLNGSNLQAMYATRVFPVPYIRIISYSPDYKPYLSNYSLLRENGATYWLLRANSASSSTVAAPKRANTRRLTHALTIPIL